MGELLEQVVGGGPNEIGYAALPDAVRRIGDDADLAADCRWELYRMRDRIRKKMWKNGLTSDYSLKVWSDFERLSDNHVPCEPRRFARELASTIAGEWWKGDLSRAIRDVLPQYTLDVVGHIQRAKDAVAAIAAIVDHFFQN